MLYQMHHQSRKDNNIIELVAQSDDYKIAKEIDEWCQDIIKRHSLPNGYQWLICNEKSEHFTWAVEEGSLAGV